MHQILAMKPLSTTEPTVKMLPNSSVFLSSHMLSKHLNSRKMKYLLLSFFFPQPILLEVENIYTQYLLNYKHK